MTKIRVAKTAGFCFGVKRAVDKLYEMSTPDGTGKKVYTLGPIIHNQIVVGELEKRGVNVLDSIEDAEKLTEGTIVIRSHGVDRATDERLRAIAESSDGKIVIYDATCPFVKKIQRIAEKESANGKTIIVCGDPNHPEVKGILGWSGGSNIVVENTEQAEKVDFSGIKSAVTVAQTTFNYKKFKDIVDIFEKIKYNSDYSVVNTVCNATEERQSEARTLAAECDAMLIIGDENSSNTRKLFEISKAICPDTFFIRDARDLERLRADEGVNFNGYDRIGITAGASTPHNIIEEVQIIMNMEEDFGRLLEEENLKSIRNGEVVEGTVFDVKEDLIVLDIGYKADGIITKSEYTKDPTLDLTTVVKPGDKLAAKVLKVNDGDGQVLLSYRKAQTFVTESKVLEEAAENHTVVSGKVAEVVPAGLNVVVDGVRVFIPASLVSDVFERNLDQFKDQDIEFYISEYNPKKRRVIGDRKTLVAEQKAAKQEAALADIREGDVFEGIVKNITDFGVFVDIGDIDGLLHVSEMGWGRTENPKKAFKVGDQVKVFVKEIKDGKVALSKKFDDENPWRDAEERFAVDTVVTGKIARMTSFGAFVELAPGVDALLHVSQIASVRVEKPGDVLTTGQVINARVVKFEPEDKKISISLRGVEGNEEIEAKAEACAAANKLAKEAAEAAKKAEEDEAPAEEAPSAEEASAEAPAAAAAEEKTEE